MKKFGILLLACITALNLWAEEFKIGKFTFKTITPTTVELIGADKDITKAFLSETIDYEGNSYIITSIGNQALEDCKSLTSVTIPNSVTSIGLQAFVGCSALKSVTIPNSVTSIENYAFLDCSSLTSVTIPNSVTSIGIDAFKGTALYNNLANWGKGAFWKNGALYIDDCLIKVDEGFASHFRIKENTRVIADYAFENCSALKSATIPNSVTSIGRGAFEDCSSLTSVTIPNSVTSIGEAVFYGCKSLTSVTIPNSVTSTGEGAFYGCKSLTSVTIPNSVTSIGYQAFLGCSSLTSITIPNSVTSIEEDAFEGTALYNNPANWGNGALYIDDCLIKVDEGFVGHCCIKENTRVIADYAFEDCSALTFVTIPKSVTSIGERAFYGCTSLTSVTIPNSVTSIGEAVFYGCKSLTSVTIPNSVTSIRGGRSRIANL